MLPAFPQTAPAVLLAAPALLFFLTPWVDMLLGPRKQAPPVKVGAAAAAAAADGAPDCCFLWLHGAWDDA